MIERDKAKNILLRICPDWVVCATNALGNSGGISPMWNPMQFSLIAYKSFTDIILTGYCRGSLMGLCILNVYAPYANRKELWQNLDVCGLLELHPLIVTRDLNFTMNAEEIWIQKSKLDPLAGYFNEVFACKMLKDISPIP